MLLAISVLLTILGIRFKKSKGMFYIVIFWEWILTGFCSDMTRFDYRNYLYHYNNADTLKIMDYTGEEPGYFLITKIFHSFGLSFDYVYKIYVIFILFSIVYVIKRNTDNVCLPAILFLWYPAIMSAYNTREGIAMGIMLFAVQILMEEKSYYLVKYIILVIIASSIHTSAIFYLIFIIIKLYRKTSATKLALITILGVILMFGIDNFTFVQTLMGTRRFLYYFGARHTESITAVISILWQCSICVLILMFQNIKSYSLLNVQVKSILFKDTRNYYSFVTKIFIMLLILCPMYFYTFTYIRLVRNILIFVYIYYAKWIDEPENSKKGFKNLVFIIWMLLTTYGFNVIVSNDYSEVIQVFYRNNNFIDIFMEHIFGVIVFVCCIMFGFCKDAIIYKNKVKSVNI